MAVQSKPIRLIYCVDGTWCGPDGSRPLPTGTLTNIYQICASIHDSSETGELVDGFFQKPVYMHGIGSADDIYSLSRLTAGVFGEGYLSQIQKVYEECCKLGPEDEVWLFGFSRGAFVVRAVAGLLHYMRALSSAGTSQFNEDYKRSLNIYQSMQRNGNLGKGRMHAHFSAATKPPPRIKFVGVLDTVKAVKEDYLFDISFNGSIQHLRHALALNEDREAMTPEYIFPETNDLKAIHGRSLVQAWFVGTHIDIGGSGSQAGLSLYPLQWLLIESQSLGLKLSFAGSFGRRAPIDNPLHLVFPSTNEQGQGAAMWSCETENEIEVSMQDLRRVHILSQYNGRYAIKLHKHLNIWPKKRRIVFGEDGSLNGWIDFLPQGTIIHPSVYHLLDVSRDIGFDDNQAELRLRLEEWRKKILGLQNNILNETFWGDHDTQVDEKLEAIRILVCGNCGVGKSTLINKVFGVPVTEVSDRLRGIHNVREELRWDTRPNLILHDSGGFEAGSNEEVNAVTAFLQEKSNAGDIGSQIHMIWFCIESRSHKMQRATEDLFKAVTQYGHEVPIIVVATKKDEFLSMKIGECSMKRSVSKSMEECIIDAKNQLEERINQIVGDISHVEKGRLDDWVAVSEDDRASIEELIDKTSRCISIEKARRRSQRARIDLKISDAIGDAMLIYEQTVQASTAIAGVPFAPVSTRAGAGINVCKHILACFGLPKIRSDVALQIVKTNIWNSLGNSVAIAVAELSTATGLIATILTLGHPFFLVPSATNIPLVVPATARLILTLSADLILILTASFTAASQRSVGQPLDSDLEAAACAYLPFTKEVHRKIKDLIPKGDVGACFRFEKVRAGLEEVIECYRSKVVNGIAAKRTGRFKDNGDESRSSLDSCVSSLGEKKEP